MQSAQQLARPIAIKRQLPVKETFRFPDTYPPKMIVCCARYAKMVIKVTHFLAKAGAGIPMIAILGPAAKETFGYPEPK